MIVVYHNHMINLHVINLFTAELVDISLCSGPVILSVAVNEWTDKVVINWQILTISGYYDIFTLVRQQFLGFHYVAKKVKLAALTTRLTDLDRTGSETKCHPLLTQKSNSSDT